MSLCRFFTCIPEDRLRSARCSRRLDGDLEIAGHAHRQQVEPPPTPGGLHLVEELAQRWKWSRLSSGLSEYGASSSARDGTLAMLASARRVCDRRAASPDFVTRRRCMTWSSTSAWIDSRGGGPGPPRHAQAVTLWTELHKRQHDLDLVRWRCPIMCQRMMGHRRLPTPSAAARNSSASPHAAGGAAPVLARSRGQLDDLPDLLGPASWSPRPRRCPDYGPHARPPPPRVHDRPVSLFESCVAIVLQDRHRPRDPQARRISTTLPRGPHAPASPHRLPAAPAAMAPPPCPANTTTPIDAPYRPARIFQVTAMDAPRRGRSRVGAVTADRRGARTDGIKCLLATGLYVLFDGPMEAHATLKKISRTCGPRMSSRFSLAR